MSFQLHLEGVVMLRCATLGGAKPTPFRSYQYNSRSGRTTKYFDKSNVVISKNKKMEEQELGYFSRLLIY